MKQEDGLSSQMKLVFVFFVTLFSSIENPGFVFGSTGNDTLLPGQSHAPGQALVSNNGAYQFGFFADYDYIKETYFLSIYIGYDSDNSDIIVWQANKEAPMPVPMSDPVLNLSESGDLVLVDQSDESHLIIWSLQVTGSETISVNLVLLNTGNLVLMDSKNSSRIMWQSFDHQTDTWLPGARLGLNLSLTYTDWSYGYDSGPSFSLEIDPSTTHGFIIRQNSSSLTYHGMFPHWMDIHKDGDNLVTFYDTKEHSHLFVNLSPWQISIFQWVNESMIRVLWSEPNSPCDVDSVCGPYSLCSSGGYHGPDCSCLNDFTPKSIENWNKGIYEKGCTRSMSLDCEINKYNYHVGSFYWVNNINRFPDNSHSLAVKIEDECENSCFKDCSCTAFSYTNGNCSLWFGELLNAKTGHPDGYVVYVINISKISMDYKHKSQTFQSRDHTIIIMLILGLVVIISVVSVIFCLFKRVTLRNPSKINNLLVLYTYPQIKSITKTFSQKLGEGGFGTVFKGKLSDSSFVAVKKLKIVCYEEKQFRSEIQTIGIIQHVNLVRLLGFCAEGTKRLLVYEYMQNGSLNSHLFSNSSEILSWKTRYQVAVGIARGLAYLHEECRDCIINCDIKPENILLDEKFCPQIADFGMAKLLGRNFSRVLTTMRGTIGYLAPEWISGQPITQKADVYSFGMMLFEIISGRRNVEKIKNRECTYFPLYAAIKINQGEVFCLLDEKLEVNNSDVEEITIVCRVACWCIQDFEDDRPTTSQIVQMLEGILQIEMPPSPKSLQNLVDIENGSSYFEPS